MYSPLLENEGGVIGEGDNINTNNYSFSKKNSKDPELALLSSTTTQGTSYDNIETAFEINGGSGSPYNNNDDNNSTTSSTYAGACCPCIPQVLKSALAILLGIGTIAASILCFIFKPVDHPIEDYVVIYVMAAFGILNSLMMIWYEKSFIFSLPTSRRALILLVETRKLLKAENHAYTKEVEVLERNLNKCEEDESKLRGITQSQSSSVDELVRLVLDNEKTLDMIRDNLRQVVIMDAIKIIINDLDPTQVIDHVMAKSLAAKIKTKVESSHGILFDEDKFMHALATNSTFNGAIRTIKELLPGGHIASNDVDKGNDIYDMFYLSTQDSRQLGSVYAARAIISGTNMSLAQSNLRASPPVKQDPDDDEEWNENENTEDEDVPEQYRNRLKEQWHQFCMMSFPFFRESGKGRCLFGTLLVLTFVSSGINVYFSYLIRDFNTALSEKEVQKFYQVMMKFILSMIVLVPLQVSFRFIRVQLGICWRKWLTERVLKLYFSNKVYYGLERQAKAAGGSARDYQDRRNEMDNPDQRIQEDVNSFTNYSLSFFLTIVHTAVDLVSFCFILWSIMPQLFIAIILFAGVGTLFTILIGKVLIKLNYESLQREADFRFNLVRIRENAESIAFYGGEAVESNKTGVKFDRVIDNQTLINWAQLRLDTFTATYNHIVNILPIFILAHQYFTGIIEFGVIAQSRQAFWHVLDDLSIIIHEFNGIASFMAGIDRLFLFMKAIQELDPDRSNDDKDVIIEKESFPPELSDGITVREVDTSVSSSSSTPQPILTLQNVQLTTPDNKRTLFRNLNLRLTKGQNLLIAGVSGAGKSSLLRAIAGLWDKGDGEITRTSDVYFLPQRPYCPPGTLRDQLLYPSTELGQSPSLHLNDWSDEALLNILNVVDLPNLASIAGDGDPMKGIHSTLDWSNTLSLGEQQRLAFGRLLINRPKLVVMDESTSALDVVAERRMYTLIRERLISAEGVPASYVSVGHRPTLLQYHDIRLLLRDGQGFANFIVETEASADEETILASRA